MERRDRLELFRQMVQCCHKLHFWEYDAGLVMLDSSCPYSDIIGSLLLSPGSREMLLSYASRHEKPMIMTGVAGMMFTAIPEKEEQQVHRFHVMGPFFMTDSSGKETDQLVYRLHLTPDLRKEVGDFLRMLPVISLGRVFEYSIMFYFSITGKRISVSDMHYQESEMNRRTGKDSRRAEVHGTYEMEQEMVRMIREGDLNIQSHISRLAVSGRMGILADKDSRRQMKNAVLACTVLFSRAAIEGGLSPEVAMTLSDHYFQSVENSRTMTELTETAATMQNDFVERVHKVRSRTLSKPILDCCDYINMHLEEKLSLQDLAERFRYSASYLSRKFREDTGRSFKEYVRMQRLSRAKTMLKENTQDIREISEQLGFCSPSYFAEQFRMEYGISPTEWRDG